MKKLLIKVLFLIILIVPVLLGCRKNNGNTKCISFSNTEIIGVNGPDSGLVNLPSDYTVQYPIGGCETFNGFKEIKFRDTIVIYATIQSALCNPCPQFTFLTSSIYQFKSTKAGTYYLKFFQTNNASIFDTLKIK